MKILFILVLAGLMHAFRSFSSEAAAGKGVTLALGYLLLTAYFTGEIFGRLRLPKLTGYLVTGTVTGPSVANLITERMVDDLALVNGMAISLIALTAGTELAVREMKPLLRTIGWITLCGVGGTIGLLTLTALLAQGLLPFLSPLPFGQALAVAAVLGVVMAAQSPAVVVALRDELRAEGPVVRTVLGVVVIADMVVIVLFALMTAVAKAFLGAGPSTLGTARSVGWELFGSLGAGVVLGGLLTLYLRKVRGRASLFLVTVAFVAAEVGQRLGLDPLLVALAAGALVRNLTSLGDELLRQIRISALPVYVLFFAVAGANLHLQSLLTIGVPAFLFVMVRGWGLVMGTRMGVRLADGPETVRRFAGYGLLPQAGLALALSTLFAKTFPEFGAEAGTLTLAVVAINELVSPVLYRAALIRSGEAYQNGGLR